MLLGSVAFINRNNDDADFFLEDDGKPTEDGADGMVAIKVTDTTVLVPKFLYYMIENLYNQGFFRNFRPEEYVRELKKLNLQPR